MKSRPILIVSGDPKSIFFEIFIKSIKSNSYRCPLILISSSKLLKLNLKKYKYKKNIKILNKNFLDNYKLNNKKINLIDIDYKTSNNLTKNNLNTNTFYLHLKPVYQLLLVGAGEVARCVAELAQKVDFQVSLCDYREDFLQGWHVDGVEILREMPDDVIEKGFSHKFCAIIALAHDPRIDDMAMMQALTTNAFYVGAMGSERTSTARRIRLKDLSITDEQMDKLHAPIGLSIRSKTPYEIAFSIVSHLIAERANKTGENSCQQPVCYS